MERHPMKHVFLVDGSGFIFRAFHGLPPMSRSDGTPTNAVFGFCSMLMKLLDDTEADHIAVIFDTARKTFRNDFYPEYKAHRPPAPDELIPQFPLIRDAVRAFNVPSIEMEGFEADDLIATYARQAAEAGAEVTIVSSDKDLMQLVNDRVTMFDAMKNRVIGPEQVIEKFGVGPDKVIEVQALAGDSSDNVPGVPGIGIKTAAQLITEYGDLESLLARAEEIKQPKRREKLIEFADSARVSKRLVTLDEHVPVKEPLSAFATRRPDVETLLAFLKEHELKRLIATVASRFGGAEGASATAAEAAPEKTDYQLVQDVACLKKWIDAITEAGSVAVDTETTSVNAMQAELVGVSLCVEAGKACYIPLRHKAQKEQASLFGDESGGDDTPEQIPFDDAMALLKPMLEDPSILKVGQNLKYDSLVLSRPSNGGVKLTPVDDTMVLSYVLEGGAHGHGMDELALLHFDHSTIKFKDVAGTGKKQVTFDYVELDKALDYAAEDADITLRLYKTLKPRLPLESMAGVYETIERPLIPVLVDMERNGIRVDAQELKRLSDDFAVRLADLEREIHSLAGREFNVGSPKQLGEVMFDDLQLPGGKKGKTGAYATGADILDKLAADGHELPVKMLEWRQLSKLKSTYADALIEQINPETKRVHTSFAMAATTTGRLASSDPNIQNIPVRTEEGRKIRKAFVAEPGHKLISADYSQIELRLLAHVAGIDTLKEAFHNGQDIHALTASQVFGVPIEGMDPMVRRSAKAINFGIVYGISAFGLAKQLDISNGEAKNYIDSYFESYPGIRAYMGRKCHIKGINEKNPNMRNFAERAAINAPIQGGAADIIKKAMIKLPGALTEAGLKAKMLLQVHDELVFEAVDAEVEATMAVVCKVMESAATLSVPLEVDVGYGNDWTEAH
jgi:DNA polymerase-1